MADIKNLKPHHLLAIDSWFFNFGNAHIAHLISTVLKTSYNDILVTNDLKILFFP